MKKLLVLPLSAYCAFAACCAVAQHAVRQPAPQADTLCVARFPWRFVPLDSLRTADILPPRPIRSVFADLAASPQSADSSGRREVAKPLRLVPVRQSLGAGDEKNQ